jgi:hypothetical protein
MYFIVDHLFISPHSLIYLNVFFKLFELPKKAVIGRDLQPLVLDILESGAQAEPILGDQISDQYRAAPADAQIAMYKKHWRSQFGRLLVARLHLLFQTLAVGVKGLANKIQRHLERLIYLFIVAVLYFDMQILDLVLEHTLVLIGGIYDVSYAQISYDLPVLCLDGATNINLTFDHAIGINSQVFVSIHGRSNIQMRTHESKL